MKGTTQIKKIKGNTSHEYFHVTPALNAMLTYFVLTNLYTKIWTIQQLRTRTAIFKSYNYVPIETHDSKQRGQEEVGHTRQTSVLFTGSIGVKFVNALTKPSLKLSLSYQGLSMF